MLWGERKLREVLNEPCAPLEENLLLTQTTERSLLDQITEDLNLIDIKKPVLLPYVHCHFFFFSLPFSHLVFTLLCFSLIELTPIAGSVQRGK